MVVSVKIAPLDAVAASHLDQAAGATVIFALPAVSQATLVQVDDGHSTHSMTWKLSISSRWKVSSSPVIGSHPISASCCPTDVTRIAVTTYSVPRRESATFSPFRAAFSNWSMRSVVQRISDINPANHDDYPTKRSALRGLSRAGPHLNMTHWSRSDPADHGCTGGSFLPERGQDSRFILGWNGQEQTARSLRVATQIAVCRAQLG